MARPSWIERVPLGVLSPAGARARLAIFTYHRVLPDRDSLLPDEPDARFFAEQMQWLARYYQVLPLADAVGLMREARLPERAACITFDDGYANNLDIAQPLLKKLGLTATVFIATDAIERGIMWNDMVIEAVRRAGASIAAVHLEPLGLAGPLPANNATIDALLEQLKYRPLADRWDLAAELFRCVTGAEPPRLMLTPDSIRALADAGVAIGAHTVHHPILKTQSADEARSEIVASRRWLGAILQAPPVAFAYPNGRPGRDYDESHVEMVRAAGFTHAVSTSWGCATRASDVFQLPRVAFWDRSRMRYWLRSLKTYASSY
ncbi:MAG: polysaccharide deacetylase family protein [Steroidobacterales bacterium]